MDKKKLIKSSYKTCKKCNRICYTRRFQQYFINWTSSNDDIDIIIQDTQLSAHDDVRKALEWIPIDRFYDIKYIAEDRYRANWFDGNIIGWDDNDQNWKRVNRNMVVELKKLNNLTNIVLDFIILNKISKAYGITQDPETKDYFVILSDNCKKCNNICCAKHFQQNFNNWTSGNDDIDKFIQDAQLSNCYATNALEWVPHNRFFDIKYTAEGIYRANWIDGNIIDWDYYNQNWKRENQNMIVELKRSSNPKNIVFKFTNEISKAYGITQDPETKDYFVVLSNNCKKCNNICCAKNFQQNFNNWTSGNDDIDKFIQVTQLSNCYATIDALEWIPHNRFYDTKYTAEDIYRANWIDGNIIDWDHYNQNWKRKNQNKIVKLKKLNNPKDITLDKINKAYGITKDPETKDYMIVLDDICTKCNSKCHKIYFQQNFNNWTSGNNDIDRFIQDTQLSNCYETINALKWIPYNNFNSIIKSITEEKYRANWIDGSVIYWDYYYRNWKIKNQNTIVLLKKLNNPKNITLEYMNNKISKVYGITQDPETKDYMMVLDDICKICNFKCYIIYFQQNFNNWTSGNNDIDKFIQDTQLSNCYASNALEWIPYDKLYNIKSIAEDKYEAKWIDGNFIYWDSLNQNWNRSGQNMIVELKRLNNTKNITLEFMDEIGINYIFYGITQDPEVKNYMIVLNEKCKKCNYICYAKHFQQNFNNWTSGNYDIDEFIQDTQLLSHEDMGKALEWIPYDKFHNIKSITEDKYRANWIDGNIISWNIYNQNWDRSNQNMIVELKRLNNPKNITLEFMDKIGINYKFYGITQDPKTKNYMLVLNEYCKKCNYICYAKHFQQNFNNWTSGNYDIDEFIQDTQLLSHEDMGKALEWIPYDKFHNIKSITEDKYRANWIDGNIISWNIYDQNWDRSNKNMIVELKKLNNPTNITPEYMNKISKAYGITQDPETKDYIIVLNVTCKECNYICYTIHFQQNFNSWTSGNDDIDKIIQDIQLSSHADIEKALEWIPYINFYNIKSIAEDRYRANWIDGSIINWDNNDQNWKRENQNMIMELKRLNNPKEITLELMAEMNKTYGITQNPETNEYMTVLSDKCKKCKCICYTIHFQQNFNSWTSGNDDIDKIIQDIQLSAHDDAGKALEWIPSNRICDIKYIAEDRFYKANWIYGNIINWDNNNQNWERIDQNIIVELKRLNNPKEITLEFMTEVNKVYGITQNPETNDYMIVLSDKCKKCNHTCHAKYFQQNFKNWTSSNNDIDKFIQDTQLSNCYASNVLEWIPYDKFYDIEYIAKGGFGKVYRANWIDGNIIDWDDYNQNWKRIGPNMLVALKSLNNSKKVTLEFMNEVASHNKVDSISFIIKLYGITQDPETKNYIMVLEYAENGNLRNYLNTNYNELNLKTKFNYLFNIASGLKNIHENKIIHRDLHIGNILKNREIILITDMGLCKPANYNPSENTKNNVYGVLPYIAPEILQGRSYTEAADIYSFGIIMYEVISGLPPYHNLSHDNYLAIKICQGLRPRFNIKVPQLIVCLIKTCLDANSLNRPTANTIRDKLWEFILNTSTENQQQISKNVDGNLSSISNNISSASLWYKTHSEAIYESRLLNFYNLPEPKNSDDYYEQNDDIISKKFSDSLQINISQLNINKDESLQMDIDN